jgi:SIR2-like domain
MDAWLQAGLNSMILHGETREKFVQLVEDELYKDLLNRADAAGQRVSLLRALGGPKRNKIGQSLALLQFLEREFGKLTLFTLARWLRRAKQCENSPRAVLTFNADGLLDLVLVLLAAQEHQLGSHGEGYPKDEFRRVLRASDDSRHVTPIYHLHGCIVPNINSPGRPHESREALVFPESGYSRVSSTIFTWQQTVFLSHAQSQRLVFMGLSLSDPNLRRWLSWCTANAVKEQQYRAQQLRGEFVRGDHLWITTRPREREHEKALESSLVHLGTRIGWLDTWDQLPQALENLLGVP